jgi:hypothetical protein
MTEERKHAILFAATILCARKLIECIDSDKPNFAKEYWVERAINEAEFVMEKIDKKWPQVDATSIPTKRPY